MKVVINNCFGGFGLSNKACERLLELGFEGLRFVGPKDTITKWLEVYTGFPFDKGFWAGEDAIPRNNPLLIQVVEELGTEVNTQYSKLEIVEIPEGTKWHIHEYDGLEHVAENHRTWS